MPKITGGCLCGQVRFEIDARPIAMRLCWCRDCQYFASGNATVNVVFPSDAAPGYAATGQTLISVNTHGAHGLTEEELLNRLRAELAAWFGPATAQWQHLRTYEIVHALPAYPAGQPYRQSLRLADNLYQCGDYTAYPSLNAAMATGREVAEMLLV